ncbi:MAG TPA: alkaline phosphatase family protein [Flavobacteriales bacterium]|nr:alkaline phosphatase family protein [Flavobacteriales bacterium]HIO71602.1 alkaline phosphatase family protein [Flavobacteriales bacterium]
MIKLLLTRTQIILILLLAANSVMAQLTVDSSISRIAFGSCSHENKPQPILDLVAGYNPDIFIYLGDNIYGDTRNMAKLQKKYDKLAAKPEFQELNKVCTVLATWDDHDYGENDAGRHYPFKVESKEIFLKFWNEPEDSDRRKHNGIYHSVMLGTEGKRVQIILLDTRTFRDNLVKTKGEIIFMNDYQPNQHVDSTFLGREQWEWLEEQLKAPAELRIIASSTQFSHEYNGWESWTNVPHEQKRMTDLIKSTEANGVLFISGDVHWGEISKLGVDGQYPIYDVTSSGITQTWDKIEPNKNRIGEAIAQNNYGIIEIDWSMKIPELDLKLFDLENKLRSSVHLSLTDLSF